MPKDKSLKPTVIASTIRTWNPEMRNFCFAKCQAIITYGKNNSIPDIIIRPEFEIDTLARIIAFRLKGRMDFTVERAHIDWPCDVDLKTDEITPVHGVLSDNDYCDLIVKIIRYCSSKEKL